MQNWRRSFPKRKAMRTNKEKSHKIQRWFGVMGLLLVFSVFLNLCLGSVNLSVQELCLAIVKRKEAGAAGNIFWYARFPRTAACMLAGAALAVSGAVIQEVLSNKLASPSIIGVNAGAGLAVTLCCAAGIYSGWKIAGAAFVGAMLAVTLIAVAAQRLGASRTTVILGGVAVNSCLNAASEAIAILMPEAGMQAADFRVGGFSTVSYTRLIPAGILIVIGLLLICSLCNELDVIALGTETAQGLGLPVKQMRTVFLGLSALLAGAAVSIAGLLGFVGLLVPHGVRRLVSDENRLVLPLSAMCGACFVNFCDLLARTLFSPYEIPVGIMLSVIGGPFFIFILIKEKGGHTA